MTLSNRVFYYTLIVVPLLVFSQSAVAEQTTLEAVAIVDKKTPDPYVEGFKAYAKELKAQQQAADLKGAVDDFVREISQPEFIDKELIK